MTIEAVDPRSARPAQPPARARPGWSGCSRALDWVLLAATRRDRRLRDLGDRRDHPPRSGRERRRPPGALRRGRARARWSRRASSIPASTGASAGSIYIALCARDGARARLRRRDARLEALDQHRLLHLPALRVRQGRARPVPGRRSSPTARSRSRELAVPLQGDRAARGVPILLVFAQPDVGTALVYIAVLAAALFVSGVRWAHLAMIGAVALLVACSPCSGGFPPAGVNVLKPYQAARLTGFTHPSSNPNDPTSYNLTQSMIAVGAGGLAGARHRRRDPDAARLPAGARHRLRLRLARRAARLLRRRAPARCSTCSSSGEGSRSSPASRDLFGAMLAGGIVFGFLFQVFVNVGMTIGIAPITGIPLPFVSVGGSSMITQPVGDRHPPVDRRARRAAPRLSVARSACDRSLGVAREARAGAGEGGRSSSPARASSCRCSRRSSAPAVRPPASSSRAPPPAPPARLDRPADEAELRAPSRAGVPIVGVSERREPALRARHGPRSPHGPGAGFRRRDRARRPRARRPRRRSRGAPARAARARSSTS